MNRPFEAKILTHVHRASDGSTKQSGEKARHKYAMYYCAFEHRGLGKLRVTVERIIITTEARKLIDMFLRKSMSDLSVQPDTDGRLSQQSSSNVKTTSI
eukprot:CAMPEP_0184997608 /NCGR_PEP_ID=MMETSP1098-20130426/60095_1 /TAXON_ID=89044 /ORGANISM="Spumella elongata, Strain CCAP 955/1" /LENGTH=98 /DNA_ID=CAMNT_0027524281 /DNA_START=86 /DNA_END=382 /DNA_ORIENTATION=+